MKKRYALSLIALSCFFGGAMPLSASRSKPFKCQEEAESYLNLHYTQGCHFYNRQDWRSAADDFERVIHFFPDSDTAAEVSFYLAICYFEMREYDFANSEFSNYLKASNQPAFFEEAVYYKFCCAEHFKQGKKRRPFKMRYCPKWISGQDLALTIYDEVIVALPNHELTVRALYSKAELLQKMENFKECVDTYQTLIRRFPKDAITPACYLRIAEAYCQQSVYEFQNPDILALAELNARKFREEFPRDEQVDIADGYVQKIKELYAKGLCDLGLFYERTNQPAASAIYYQSSIEEFPDTRIADFCRSRLRCLGYESEEQDMQTLLVDEEGQGLDISLAEGESQVVDVQFADGERQVEEASLDIIEVPEEMILDECGLPMPAFVEDGGVDEESPTFLHYSLLKKREVKHAGEK